eukprot:COSAG01_NODE_35770_length_526_cov_32.086651_1_plen_115_part_00
MHFVSVKNEHHLLLLFLALASYQRSGMQSWFAVFAVLAPGHVYCVPKSKVWSLHIRNLENRSTALQIEGHTTRRKRRHSRHSTWPMTFEYYVALILANRDESEQGETFSLLIKI